MGEINRGGYSFMVLLIIIVLIIAIPIAWLIAEYSAPRWARLLLGMASILMCFGLAYVVSSLNRLNYNAWYGSATSDLLDATIENLEAGNTDQVISTLKQLQTEYEPTYENRAHYDELVNDAVQRFKKTSANKPALEPSVVLTNPTELDEHVGQLVTIRGIVRNVKIPTIIGVDVRSFDPDLRGQQAEATGILQRHEVTSEDLAEVNYANRGPGVFYRLKDQASDYEATVRPVSP
ncbi:MAG: hypothetical protein AB8C95_12705 [Phycisphaeraceae bacterium]